MNNKVNNQLTRPDMNKDRSTSAAIPNRPQSASSAVSISGRSNSNLKSHKLFTAEDRPIFSDSNENSPVKPIIKPSEPIKQANNIPLKVTQPIPTTEPPTSTKSPDKKPLFIITAPNTKSYKSPPSVGVLSTTSNPLSKSSKFKTMSADAALKLKTSLEPNYEKRKKINSKERSSSAPIMKNTPKSSPAKKKKVPTANDTKSVTSSLSTSVSIYSAKGNGNSKSAFNRLYTVKNMEVINELKRKQEDELMRPEKKLTRVYYYYYYYIIVTICKC